MKLASRIRERLSYANVTATIALFVALGGSAYAAANLPKNSVGSKQIKKAAVTPAKLNAAAKTTLEGPRGQQGEQGKPGTPGLPGEPGKDGLSKVVVRNGPEETLPKGSAATETSFASCLPGETVVGGWYAITFGIAPPSTFAVLTNRGSFANQAEAQGGESPEGWLTTINSNGAAEFKFKAAVLCAGNLKPV